MDALDYKGPVETGNEVPHGRRSLPTGNVVSHERLRLLTGNEVPHGGLRPLTIEPTKTLEPVEPPKPVEPQVTCDIKDEALIPMLLTLSNDFGDLVKGMIPKSQVLTKLDVDQLRKMYNAVSKKITIEKGVAQYANILGMIEHTLSVMGVDISGTTYNLFSDKSFVDAVKLCIVKYNLDSGSPEMTIATSLLCTAWKSYKAPKEESTYKAPKEESKEEVIETPAIETTAVDGWIDELENII